MSTPRLVALDMDGTLLNPEGAIPDSFWPTLEAAQAAGITVAPASGRQLATLRDMFARNAPDTFIAENGAVVQHEGQVLATATIPEATARRIVEALERTPFSAHPVLCAPETSYTRASTPPEVQREVDKYYLANTQVRSLLDAPLNAIVKIALFVDGDAETLGLPWVEKLAPELHALVSSTHWLDIMPPAASKGAALLALADTLGIAHEDTAAIGDYLNDYSMLEAAGYAVAMGNAHPDLKEVADEVIGTNGEHAAVAKLAQWAGK
ncbi:HAD family hydrolase [Corynebacterium imitans]|uniref:HAD family hydrolase n=1 Tax=Corynebacterium imitans TaxID=156978 RepID=A0A076NIA6_9CORY|nr:HAD family hydrolase [Corynebacterium imitans]AIJ33128.1 HAD family hydrolase [Corynebacterium imitans]SNV63346.1 HAD family hydrolase [Corynebacterium imitans]